MSSFSRAEAEKKSNIDHHVSSFLYLVAVYQIVEEVNQFN